MFDSRPLCYYPRRYRRRLCHLASEAQNDIKIRLQAPAVSLLFLILRTAGAFLPALQIYSEIFSLNTTFNPHKNP
jgi:hypothetical protein